MFSDGALWQWLVYSAVSSGLVLLVGAIATRLFAQPAYRLRIITCVFLGCLVAPWLPGLSPWKTVSLGLLSSDVDVWLRDESATDLTTSSEGIISPELHQPAAERADRNAATPANTSAHSEPNSNADTSIAPSNDGSPPIRISKSNSVDDLRQSKPAKSLNNWLATFTVTLYCCGVAGMCVWWGIGVGRKILLKRSAQPAGKELLEVFREVTGKEAHRADLLVSDRISGPITWGLFRPVIVVPSRFAEQPDSAEMRWSLAHEWAHVERRDVGSLMLATLVQLVCFYQPLFWWFKRQLILCQDFLADARAAQQAGSVEDYAEFLVRLARSRSHAILPATLGIVDRQSRLARRVRMLLNSTRPLTFRCGIGPTILIATCAAVFLTWLSTVRLDAAAEPIAPSEKKESVEDGKTKTDIQALPASPLDAALEAALEQPLDEPGVVTGILVKAEDGTSVHGAKVLLRGNRLYHGKTDEAGRFRFERVPARDYRIWAYAGDLVSSKEIIRPVDVTDPQKPRFAPLRMTMAAGKKLKMRVISAVTDKPVEGAVISLSYPDRRRVTTEANGTAVISGLLPEDYEVTATAKGHAAERHHVDLSAVENSASISIVLPPGGVIYGVVMDEKEQPLSKADVVFRESGTSYGYYGDSPWTDREGRFRNNYLPLNRTIMLSVGAKGYLNQEQEVSLSASQPEQQIKVNLSRRSRGGSIVGIVVDQEGQPITGATLSNAGNGSGEERITKTDANGRFILNDLLEAHTGHEIIVRAPKFATVRQSVEPGTADAPSQITVKLTAGHFIHGRVVDDQQRPLQGVYVSANGVAIPGSIGETVQTDKDGRFAFDSLPQPSHFQFGADGYSSQHSVKLELDNDSIVTVMMKPEGAFRGRVVDAGTGKPVERFNIHLFGNGVSSHLINPGLTFESPDGLFIVKDLPNGQRLDLTILADGFERMKRPAILSTSLNDAKPIEVQLKREDVSQLFTLNGRIVDHAGQPVSKAQLRLIVTSQQPTGDDDKNYNWYLIKSGQLADRASCDQFFEMTSDSAGRFEAKNVLPGKYLQLAYWGDHVPQGRTLAFDETRPGVAESITVQLPKAAKITGTIDLSQFPDAGEITATIAGQAFHTYEHKLTADKTAFEFDDLPPGEYSVVVMSKPIRSLEDERFSSLHPLASQKMNLHAGETKEVRFDLSNKTN